MLPVKGIFFDLDNTIWDFSASANISLSQVYQRHVQESGVPEEFWRKAYHKHNDALWHQYRLGKVTSADVKVLRFTHSFFDVGIKNMDFTDIAHSFLQDIVDNTMLFADVLTTLSHLSKSYTLGVITNGFVASGERLAKHGLDKLFSVLITSEQIGVPKPDPRIFLHALDSVKLTPSEVAYIGDDYATDIVGAKLAGLQAILFNHKGEKLAGKDPQPDAVIYEFSSLTGLFPPRQI